jgi:hypothetical protein
MRVFKLLRGYEKKGNEFIPPGMVYAPYVPMISEPLESMNPCAEIPLGMMSSRYATRMVDGRFYQEVEVMSRHYEGVPIVEERNIDNQVFEW